MAHKMTSCSILLTVTLLLTLAPPHASTLQSVQFRRVLNVLPTYTSNANLSSATSSAFSATSLLPDFGVSNLNVGRRYKGRSYGTVARRRQLASRSVSPDGWYTGTYTIRMVSLPEGEEDDVVHLLMMDDNTMLELLVTHVDIDDVPPGSPVRAIGVIDSEGRLHPSEMYVAQQELSGEDSNEDYGESEGGTAALPGVPWTQDYVVTDMPTLIMVADICNMGVAADVATIEKVIYNEPGSYDVNLEQYLDECSYGKARMDRSNSRVVGPVVIPCDNNDPLLSFTTSDCTFSDANSWHKYAQQYVVDTWNINLDQYKYFVLLMPPYFTYTANCSWLGLGTLGPDSLYADGTYRSSQVWMSGENWRSAMAYMHELGHTNYLHHAVQGSCEYCDYSCAMGGCCALRCFNAPHNWQLGWAHPMVVLDTNTLPPASTLTFNLPAQHTSENNMMIVVPDWAEGYGVTGRKYAIFISFRVPSGRYDRTFPNTFAWATNIYYSEAPQQTFARFTYLLVSLYDGEMWTNSSNQLVVRQYGSSYQGTTISMCRRTEAVETSCHDGLDNDCDGMIDAVDPDCAPFATDISTASTTTATSTKAVPRVIPKTPTFPAKPASPPRLPSTKLPSPTKPSAPSPPPPVGSPEKPPRPYRKRSPPPP